MKTSEKLGKYINKPHIIFKGGFYESFFEGFLNLFCIPWVYLYYILHDLQHIKLCIFLLLSL